MIREVTDKENRVWLKFKGNMDKTAWKPSSRTTEPSSRESRKLSPGMKPERRSEVSVGMSLQRRELCIPVDSTIGDN